ncbi:MAG: M28 family peptidase, partial [Saprospiraceae bacterium]
MSSLNAQQIPAELEGSPVLELVDEMLEEPSQEDYGKMVTPEGIKKHLTIIASDEMEGRETGESGQRKAADYIAKHFESLGFPKVVEGSYFQKIKFVFQSWEDLNLAVGDKKYRFLWDYYAFPASNSSLDEININEVVALGYGIDDEKYSDYKGVDVTGKTIMIYQGEPLNYDSVSYITGEKNYSDWAMDWKRKLKVAKEKGVKNVLFIEPNIQAKVSKYRDRLLRGSLTMGDAEYKDTEFPNSIYISSDVAKAILGKKMQKKFIKNRKKIRKKGKPRNLTISTDMKLKLVKNTKTLEGENVLGFLEGTDKKDEIVVVTAHYDHLGMRGKDIYNGADDNGSGTSTVLRMSSVFAKAAKTGSGPRRSILFMLVSGEEKGLLGSEYYTNYPI